MISYPTGPNFVPLAVTCDELHGEEAIRQMNSEQRCQSTTAMGSYTIGTKAPIKTQNPPINSTRVVSHASRNGMGMPSV